MALDPAARVAAHPRSRGENLRITTPAERRHRLIPAHAGKTLPSHRRYRRHTAHPRSRGENVCGGLGENLGSGSSPLTRGKPHEGCLQVTGGGLIPAHAGKTSPSCTGPGRCPAHPRSRGENFCMPPVEACMLGSSPLTRGKHPNQIVSESVQRLIPAHAGKTRRLGRTRWRRPAHPRSRGENDKYWDAVGKSDGSSPLTRGKRNSGHNHPHGDRLIPAHAGKTCSVPMSDRCCTAHPRSRGENASSWTRQPSRHGSSPLTRGKPLRTARRADSRRLIPAHAGKTRRVAVTRACAAAHPRSRGENPSPWPSTRSAAGSSPLTRGKPERRGRWQRGHRLIPAHAGKTK